MRHELGFSAQLARVEGSSEALFDLEDNGMADEGFQLWLELGYLPVNFTDPCYRIRLVFGEDPPDADTAVGDDEARIVARAEPVVYTREDHGFELHDPESDGFVGHVPLLDRHVPAWLADVESSYVVVELTYDHERTLEQSRLSPEEIAERW